MRPQSKRKSDAPPGGLVASLKQPAKSRIVVPNGADNVVLDFGVKLNHAAAADLDFAFEVPYNSTLIPGITCSLRPIRLESKGATSQ